MKSNFELLKKIKRRTAKVCVIGMGYVGYPLYELIKKNKFSVYGLEIDKNKIRQLKKKKKINVSSNYKLINQSDIIIFALPTPLNQKKNPDLSILKNSIRKSFKFFKKGQLVIVESTSYPGTTKECLKQVIKKFDIGKNFFISYSPERIDPGNKNFDVKNITKIISGYTDTCLNLSNNFYKIICNLTVKASNIETAEFTKIYENIFRYVNIGLANEKKRISKKLNLDFNEIQKLASSKLFGYMNFYPGIGVGGHCIPVDPYYLVWLANKKKIKTEYVKLSGKINRSTPRIVCKEIDKVIRLRKFKKIFILGLSYKKNISDIRNSPNKINYNDDNLKNIKIEKKKFRSLKINSHNLRKQDAIIFLNNHNYYNKRNIVKNSRCIFDCTYSFPKSNKVIFI